MVTINIIAPNQTLEAVVTGLSPATNYSLTLTAFTDYGSYTGPVAYGFTLEDGKFRLVAIVHTLTSSMQKNCHKIRCQYSVHKCIYKVKKISTTLTHPPPINLCPD